MCHYCYDAGIERIQPEANQVPWGAYRVLAVLYEFAEVTETGLLSLAVLVHNGDDRIHYRLLVVEASLLSQH